MMRDSTPREKQSCSIRRALLSRGVLLATMFLVLTARMAAQEAAPRNAPPASRGPRVALRQAGSLPPPGREPILTPSGAHRIPLSGTRSDQDLQIQDHGGRISLAVRNTPVKELMTMLAQKLRLNIVCADDVAGSVTITLHHVTLDQALNAILAVGGYTWYDRGGIIHVTSIASSIGLPPGVQGREVTVFELDYAAASDIDQGIKGLLSPVGLSTIMTSDRSSNLRSREVIMVEDLPAFLDPIRQYVAQVDRPPRQVLIEASILEITLSEETRHGVNIQEAFNLSGTAVDLSVNGLANPLAPQAFFAEIDGSEFDGLLEALQSYGDTKTLASPKVLVVNGQQARFQVGQQLGFRVTTTTETSSLESVNFLDVGVILTVTPRISRDGTVLMRVKPQVSQGEINPDTQLPEESTTEVETDVLLADGKGVVIGGLIQEKQTDDLTKVPILGDLWLVGKLFQRTRYEQTRSEVVIVLVPHVVNCPCDVDCATGLPAATSHPPLVHEQLKQYPLPWSQHPIHRHHRPVRLPPVMDAMFEQDRVMVQGRRPFSLGGAVPASYTAPWSPPPGYQEGLPPFPASGPPPVAN